ncbi:hypothetical protein OSSY52_03400 [Tepiditoga spiralis]|uniref:phospholipase D n=1 Tax=Tepiditoga spiralis TaxID=2108365 RepID=A0A7G1GA09_9BACT|nr:phospholipase D-like domain-containing protein [Tepiditoga spiralis]BBE30199.1 hypothetical protein OSSY52_03400 [Tepiditoga spiralis]
MRKFLSILIILTLPILVFLSDYNLNLSNGDYLWINGLTDNIIGHIPGMYEQNNELFFRADNSVSEYSFDIGLNKWKIGISKNTNDSTVLFYDISTQDRNNKNLSYFLNLINGAKKFIYLSVYDLDNVDIVNALISAKNRGVDVRVVIESGNRNTKTDFKLPNNNIPIIYDMNSAYMHNKFGVIDGYCVVTGSTNLTETGINSNSNNMFIVFNNELAQDYMEEFNEQFNKKMFGKYDDNIKSFVKVKTNSGLIEPFFMPEDDLKDRLVQLINSAQQSIDIMMFTFTDKEIANALLDAKNRGLKIRIIMETFQAKSSWSVYSFIKSLNPVLDKNPRTFHHKVMIIDNSITVTGSYNFTNSAQFKNDENALIIHSQDVSHSFTKEFNRFWTLYTKK